MEVLRTHPGARVALIFGANHEFRDDFERLPNPPTVLTLYFEKLGKSIMEHLDALKP